MIALQPRLVRRRYPFEELVHVTEDRSAVVSEAAPLFSVLAALNTFALTLAHDADHQSECAPDQSPHDRVHFGERYAAARPVLRAGKAQSRPVRRAHFLTSGQDQTRP